MHYPIPRVTFSHYRVGIVERELLVDPKPALQADRAGRVLKNLGR